jgi:hypothetical protein
LTKAREATVRMVAAFILMVLVFGRVFRRVGEILCGVKLVAAGKFC